MDTHYLFGFVYAAALGGLCVFAAAVWGESRMVAGIELFIIFDRFVLLDDFGASASHDICRTLGGLAIRPQRCANIGLGCRHEYFCFHLDNFSVSVECFYLIFCLGFRLFASNQTELAWAGGLILLLLTVIWVKSRLFSNEYDAQKYGNLGRGLQQIFTTGELLPSMRAFLRHCLSDYYWFVIVVALNIGTYLRRRQWLLAVWQLGNVVGLAIIVQLTIHDDGGKFYIDNMYLPLGFMAALPLLYDTIGDSFKKDTSYIATNYHPIIWAHAALIAFAVVRMYQVWARQDIYQARHAWLVQTVDKLKTLEGRCFIATEADVPKDILLLCTWSVGYETLLLSSYDDPNQARTLLIVPSFDRYNHLMQASENRWFGTVWGDLDTWVLPTFKKYFPLPDMQYRQVTLPLK
jgi:hypothetical protein